MSDINKRELKSVVFLGDAGFPIGLAGIQRMTLMGRALINAGCSVSVVNRIWAWNKDLKTDYGKEGVHEGIHYMFTVESPFRPEGFFNRKFQRFMGLWNEFFYLKKLKNEGRIDAVILSTMNFNDSLRYKIYSKVIGFPIAVNLVEMASALERRSSLTLKIHNWLMENWLLKRLDGAMPISDNLCAFYKEIAPSKPIMKVPVICDYDSFSKIKKNTTESYFLYCASISFMEVTEFVLKAYELMKNNEQIKLRLLIGGKDKTKIKRLQEEIALRFPNENVELFSNVPYQVLMELFTNAKALLIPLRHTLEDTARFPHKIGEYLATGNPIITTGVGEINTYFNDALNALISDEYDAEKFAAKMDYVVENSDEVIQIGLQGKSLGLKNFHFDNYGTRIKHFLEQL